MINFSAKYSENSFTFEIKPKGQAIDPINPENRKKAEDIFKK